MLKAYCLKAKAAKKPMRKSLTKNAIQMYWSLVGVCFSPAGLKQWMETRTQTIRLPLCIDQTVCSCFRKYVSLIQVVLCSLNLIQADTSN